MPTDPTHPPFLTISGLTAGYERQRPVFHDLTFTHPTPGLLHIVGPNGSGKTTFLELLSGFLPPHHGTVTLCGTPADHPTAREIRSVCRTTPSLYPSMTARDHLAFAARCRSAPLPPLLERAHRYGLADWLEYPASDLSTGNQRKLWLLACTAIPTPIVIADEPFNGLDDHGIHTLRDELTDAATTGLVVLITHTLPADLTPTHTLHLRDGSV